jgi:hypothetical protein
LIRDVEALLIKCMGAPGNSSDTKFAWGNQWEQIKRDEATKYLGLVSG